jgi:hypothetical protein
MTTRFPGRLYAFLLIVAVAHPPAQAAKYAGEFLRLGMGARAWGLGGAYSAIGADATAVYWNPANLADLRSRDLMLMHSETFGALLNYDAAALALPAPGYGTDLGVGFALFRLGGDIQRTRLANPNLPISDSNRVVTDGESAGASDWAAYAGLGKRLNARLAVGAALKLIYRDLVDVTAVGFGLDVGARYTPHPWWSGALTVYDLTTTLLAYDNGTKESVNPSMALGLALHPRWERVAVTLSTDGLFQFEGRQLGAQFHQGKVSLDLRWGAEVLYFDRLAVRGGLDKENPTLGVGIRFRRFSVDGAWRSDDLLDDSYRFSLSHNW